MTIRRMRNACWITQATNTHSEYVILTAFPGPQWLHERATCYVIRTLPVLLGLRSSAVEVYVSPVIGVRRFETALMVLCSGVEMSMRDF